MIIFIPTPVKCYNTFHPMDTRILIYFKINSTTGTSTTVRTTYYTFSTTSKLCEQCHLPRFLFPNLFPNLFPILFQMQQIHTVQQPLRWIVFHSCGFAQPRHPTFGVRCHFSTCRRPGATKINKTKHQKQQENLFKMLPPNVD